MSLCLYYGFDRRVPVLMQTLPFYGKCNLPRGSNHINNIVYIYIRNFVFLLITTPVFKTFQMMNILNKLGEKTTHIPNQEYVSKGSKIGFWCNMQ